MLARPAMNGFEAAPRRTMARPATLCVHFAGRATAHAIWFAEPAPAAEVERARTARLVAEWDDAAGPLLHGRALLRGEVACHAYLLTASDPVDPARDRDLLRAAGVSRDRAACLARMPQRPLLATAARGPDLSPQLLRRIHSLLVATRPAATPRHASA